MDELIEVADVLVDGGLDGVVTTLVRLVGLVALLAGAGVWLLTDAGLFVVPAALLLAGVVLLAVPGVLVGLLELA
mgnify:CR=1 FL=1